MKFAEHLGAHITPEWRKQYIQYEEMKALLYRALEGAPSAEVVEEEVLTRYFARFDEAFFTFCTKELTKINTFYAEKLAEATRKLAMLRSEMEVTEADQVKKKKLQRRKMMDLKLAFSEFYLSLILLQNYQNLNFTGFRKILKKHDKLLQTEAGAVWRVDHVEASNFHTNKDIDKLISDTEATVTSELEGGDRQKAMKRLRVPPLVDRGSPWTTFKVGLFTGAFLVLVIAMILSASFFHSDSPGQRNDWRVVVRLYRGPLLTIFFLSLMGINVYGWRSSGVNHVLIFELDPRSHLSEQHLMELAAVFGVVWTSSVLTFLYSSQLNIPAYINPLSLAGLMAIFMLNPTRTFKHEARFWFLRVAARILLAPFCYVGFADFWMADQLNSLSQALKDYQYLICFYLTSGSSMDAAWSTASNEQCSDKSWWVVALVSCLPAWFRFAQCLRRYKDTKEGFPHLLNAGKYSTTFISVLFATLNAAYSDGKTYTPFFYLYVIASAASSCYTYVWDIKMDWGFFAKTAGDNQFLRDELVYSSAGYYYFAIIEDLVLRLSWLWQLLLTDWLGLQDYSELIVSVFALLEVSRRFVWNFFRLENEHINNCGKFRAVRDISVAPIDASDQQQIIKLMDNPDPSSLWRSRRKADPLRVPLLVEEDERVEVERDGRGVSWHLGPGSRAVRLEEDLTRALLGIEKDPSV
jgi:hypothetical protein